jgi:transcriptional regulator with XRE-family HTH domain
MGKISMDFGNLIKQLREEKSLNQRQFAEMLKITPTYLSKIERGEFAPPSEEIIKNMAKLLNYNSDKLLAYADKIDSELENIIKSDPLKYAGLLRQRAKND